MKGKLKVVESISVEEFYASFKDELKLILVAGEMGLKSHIREKSINRPSLVVCLLFKCLDRFLVICDRVLEPLLLAEFEQLAITGQRVGPRGPAHLRHAIGAQPERSPEVRCVAKFYNASWLAPPWNRHQILEPIRFADDTVKLLPHTENEKPALTVAARDDTSDVVFLAVRNDTVLLVGNRFTDHEHAGALQMNSGGCIAVCTDPL